MNTKEFLSFFESSAKGSTVREKLINLIVSDDVGTLIDQVGLMYRRPSLDSHQNTATFQDDLRPYFISYLIKKGFSSEEADQVIDILRSMTYNSKEYEVGIANIWNKLLNSVGTWKGISDFFVQLRQIPLRYTDSNYLEYWNEVEQIGRSLRLIQHITETAPQTIEPLIKLANSKPRDILALAPPAVSLFTTSWSVDYAFSLSIDDAVSSKMLDNFINFAMEHNDFELNIELKPGYFSQSFFKKKFHNRQLGNYFIHDLILTHTFDARYVDLPTKSELAKQLKSETQSVLQDMRSFKFPDPKCKIYAMIRNLDSNDEPYGY